MTSMSSPSTLPSQAPAPHIQEVSIGMAFPPSHTRTHTLSGMRGHGQLSPSWPSQPSSLGHNAWDQKLVSERDSPVSTYPLPDDASFLAAVREALAAQTQQSAASGSSATSPISPSSRSPATPLDEASILLAVRQAMVEVGARAGSGPEDASTELRVRNPSVAGAENPFLDAESSTIVASLKNGPANAGGARLTTSTSSGDEHNRLLTAIKSAVASQMRPPKLSVSTNAPPRRNRGARPGRPVVRHEADGGAVPMEPMSPTSLDVLPPMYDPQWEDRRRQGAPPREPEA